MNLFVLALALLACLVLAIGAMSRYAIGDSQTVNSLPLPWFRHSVNIPPMPEHSPSIGLTVGAVS